MYPILLVHESEMCFSECVGQVRKNNEMNRNSTAGTLKSINNKKLKKAWFCNAKSEVLHGIQVPLVSCLFALCVSEYTQDPKSEKKTHSIFYTVLKVL